MLNFEEVAQYDDTIFSIASNKRSDLYLALGTFCEHDNKIFIFKKNDLNISSNCPYKILECDSPIRSLNWAHVVKNGAQFDLLLINSLQIDIAIFKDGEFVTIANSSESAEDSLPLACSWINAQELTYVVSFSSRIMTVNKVHKASPFEAIEAYGVATVTKVSPYNSSVMAVGLSDGSLYIYDLCQLNSCVVVFHGNGNQLLDMQFIDENHVASMSEKGTDVIVSKINDYKRSQPVIAYRHRKVVSCFLATKQFMIISDGIRLTFYKNFTEDDGETFYEIYESYFDLEIPKIVRMIETEEGIYAVSEDKRLFLVK